MLDQTRIDELVEVLEDAYDKYSSAKAITKEAATMMKDWAARAEIDPKNVREVYKSYAAYRDGKLKWGEGDADDDFAQLLVQVMDSVAK